MRFAYVQMKRNDETVDSYLIPWEHEAFKSFVKYFGYERCYDTAFSWFYCPEENLTVSWFDYRSGNDEYWDTFSVVELPHVQPELLDYVSM